MATPASTGPVLYCRKCSYDLRGQVEHRCPECGSEYGPADPKTFRRRPRSHTAKWVRRTALAAAVFLLATAAPFAWLYYGWRREQPAIRRMNELSAIVTLKSIDLPLLPRLLPRRYGWMLDRVDGIRYARWDATDADLALTGRCRRLTRLEFYSAAMSDKGVEAIAGLTELRYLTLTGQGITDVSAARLARLRQLQELWLENTSLTDAGLAQICRLPEIRTLYIKSPYLTDAGLAPLADVPKLTHLLITTRNIGDEGLATLSRLTRLTRLYVEGDGYTAEGEERLRQALPKCVLDVNRHTPRPRE